MTRLLWRYVLTAVVAAAFAASGTALVQHTWSAPTQHTIRFEVGAWPAKGEIGWSEQGRTYSVPLGTFEISGPIEAAWIRVEAPDIGCDLIVDRVTMAYAPGIGDGPATCRWGAVAP